MRKHALLHSLLLLCFHAHLAPYMNRTQGDGMLSRAEFNYSITFFPGDTVIWKLEDESTPAGSIGTVIGYADAVNDDFVNVRFPGGHESTCHRKDL